MAMAFHWRKVKSRKISQFVNDHLHNSRKRRDGSSLVVETGFPTSLVDLFMKNREKLKKPLNNRRKDSKPSIVDDDAVPVNQVSHEKTPQIRSSVASGNGDEILEVGIVNDDSRAVSEECIEDSGRNTYVIFKLFLVMFVLLGTNKLTMGITISVFILFALDYFENRISISYIRSKALFQWLQDNQNYCEVSVQEMDITLTEPEMVETSDDSAIVVEEIQAETACSLSQRDDLLEQQHPKSKKSSKRATVISKLKFFAKRFKARKLKMQTENKLPSEAVTGLPCISSSSCREEDIDPTVASVDELIRSSKVDEAGNINLKHFRG